MNINIFKRSKEANSIPRLKELPVGAVFMTSEAYGIAYYLKISEDNANNVFNLTYNEVCTIDLNRAAYIQDATLHINAEQRLRDKMEADYDKT